MSECECGHDIDDHDINGIRGCHYSICDCTGFKLHLSKESRASIEELNSLLHLHKIDLINIDERGTEYIKTRINELKE